MPTIDFPSSPTVNQTYSFGGKTWKWNGSAWDYIGSSSGTVIDGGLPDSTYGGTTAIDGGTP